MLDLPTAAAVELDGLWVQTTTAVAEVVQTELVAAVAAVVAQLVGMPMIFTTLMVEMALVAAAVKY
jgi:hypothetical protein